MGIGHQPRAKPTPSQTVNNLKISHDQPSQRTQRTLTVVLALKCTVILLNQACPSMPKAPKSAVTPIPDFPSHGSHRILWLGL